MQEKEERQIGNAIDEHGDLCQDSGNHNNGSDGADRTSVSGYRFQSAVQGALGGPVQPQREQAEYVLKQVQGEGRLYHSNMT